MLPGVRILSRRRVSPSAGATRFAGPDCWFTGLVRRKQKLSLEDVYRRIPAVECKGLCIDSCGPIAMSKAEDARIRERGVAIPPMAVAMAALERGDDYYCPALENGRCSVYSDRPAICRLWGATESMPCPHGCTPPDALTQSESHELLLLAASAGGGMVDGFGAKRRRRRWRRSRPAVG
jgi:uncharacterized protein